MKPPGSPGGFSMMGRAMEAVWQQARLDSAGSLC